MITPDRTAFRELARQGNLVPVVRTILADCETPVSAFYKIHTPGADGFLLESVVGAEAIARYSFLGSEPAVVFRSKGRHVSISEPGAVREFESDNPLAELEQLMQQYQAVEVPGLPRFAGGAVGYVGYDMVRFFEQLPDETDDDLDMPDAYFVLTDRLLIFDHFNRQILVVAHAHITDGADAAYDSALADIETLTAKLRGPSPPPATEAVEGRVQVEMSSNMTPERYQEIVQRGKEYIRAGDVFQVVLSQRFETPVTAEPLTLYRALRSVNPSPYMFYLDTPDFTLVGASPEMMVRKEGDVVSLRPIAGTRRRDTRELSDEEIAEDLLSDPKECAEHIMLVDLGRNDVGRVSELATVNVTELMVIEQYSHVIHIVSHVEGTLASGRTAFDVLRATVPAGTLSGAPKIRAMEIIEELEAVKRGPYGGTMCYFGFSGNLDSCIIIRTLLVKDGTAYVQAGAGIVADSDPPSEHEECLNKALATVRAIELAENGLAL